MKYESKSKSKYKSKYKHKYKYKYPKAGWQNLAAFRWGQKWPWKFSSSTYLQFSRQNSVYLGLKCSCESKLFGRGPPCPRKTSATLPKSTNTNTYSFGSHVQDLRVKLDRHPWSKGGECLDTIYHIQKVQWYILAPLHDSGIPCFILDSRPSGSWGRDYGRRRPPSRASPFEPCPAHDGDGPDDSDDDNYDGGDNLHPGLLLWQNLSVPILKLVFLDQIYWYWYWYWYPFKFL